jgi:SAM-dependent methyltransferase
MDEDGRFNEEVAQTYDEYRDPMFSAEVIDPAVDFLVRQARGGRALEFAIGTGRIALPLAGRGVEVSGIDMSKAMVARLRAKPGGSDLPVVVGDFSAVRVEGSFRLVYLVYNTIQNVTSQQGQVATFANAAAHLEPGGVFVIEVGMPDLQRLPVGEKVVPFDLGDYHVGVDEYDVANQGLISHHFTKRGDRWEYSSGPFRYVWPSELDLMAQMAGMELTERWSGWRGEPFTSDSRKFISVWKKREQ